MNVWNVYINNPAREPSKLFRTEHVRMKAIIQILGCVALCLPALCVGATGFAQSETGRKDQPVPLKLTVRNDVVYGTVHGAGLLADIAFPESKQPLPAIISVHGGRWVGGHKRDASTIKVEQWAGFGFFAMSIDYRLKGCTPGSGLLSGPAVRDPLRARPRPGTAMSTPRGFF